MLFGIQSYLNFLARSTNEHGVHSPFVFQLVTKCFYDRTEYPEYTVLRQYRKALLGNDELIGVADFGAGSRVFKSDYRKISAIAKTAGISKKRAELLFRMVRYFRPKQVLEVGTSLGLATAALASGYTDAQIVTLEGCPETASVAEKSLAAAGIGNVRVVVDRFENTWPELLSGTYRPDFVYFDGNHTKEATVRYFNTLLPTATNDTVWVFDDIHWSAEMESAWEIIKKNPRVTVTVDTFQWGLVFFRKEQQKEDFVIRV
ncbi:methyltransferase [Flavobacterium magnum]|uniref:Methyltransferase n=1 Tax=Flavobacterium magnum TaxID=2162713 RepID=A0A2S0RDJ0_9FLAO|nr:class I SAM-dependent methyltransferase [Flavobacterium magnum]AWA30007.1 methyltransferase [Flavobacterium magnum]